MLVEDRRKRAGLQPEMPPERRSEIPLCFLCPSARVLFVSFDSCMIGETKKESVRTPAVEFGSALGGVPSGSSASGLGHGRELVGGRLEHINVVVCFQRSLDKRSMDLTAISGGTSGERHRLTV